MSKPRVLFVVDTVDWAYDDRAKNWQKILHQEFEIDILHLKSFQSSSLTPLGLSAFNQLLSLSDLDLNNPDSVTKSRMVLDWVRQAQSDLTTQPAVFDYKRYDGILFFYSRALRDRRLLGTPLDPSKVGVCINNEKWVSEGVIETLSENFSEAKVIAACNKKILEDFSPHHPNVLRLSQAVNMEVFNTYRKDKDKDIVRPSRVGGEFVIGWTGNYQNPIKNVDFLREAQEEAGVKILISKNRTREELNEWYNTKVDALVCVSESEGGPLMLLEAGACSKPVITTPVGLAREIVRDGETGLVVPHGNKESLVKAIKLLAEDLELRRDLAVNLHSEIAANWTFEARIDEIRTVLKTLCGLEKAN